MTRSHKEVGRAGRAERPGGVGRAGRGGAGLPEEVADAVLAAGDKKAIDLVVLDLRKAAGFTDYFLICSGQNARQIRAIADGIIQRLAARGSKPAHVEGYERSEWILIDYFDFIVHIFAPETRLFYGLERLWGNAERVKAPAAPA
jgi:ribosome-associated protein